MNTLKEIAEVLFASEKVNIFPHSHMDGDAIGSSTGLYLALKKLGKEVYIACEDSLADNLKFVGADYLTDYEKLEPAGTSVAIDCGDTSRFEKRKELFEKGNIKVCIDHHETSKPVFDYNHIDGDASAASELAAVVVKELEVLSGKQLFDEEIMTAFFTGIVTDTGCFMYSSTTKRCHDIAGEFIAAGLDGSAISTKLWENERLSKVVLNAKAVSNMQLFADGKAAITVVTREDIASVNGDENDTDGIVEQLRNVSGVEIACFVKEIAEGKCKVSYRAKSYANVAQICQKYGGGGHSRAAGCTLVMPVARAKETVMKDVLEYFSAN